MLSNDSAEIVQATLPVVGAHALEITTRFYGSLFADHPALLDVFNRGNQANGEQQQALAASVAAFASHLVSGADDHAFDPVLRRIAHKHASLGVRPEQYTVVGRYLMGAVGHVLGEAVTPQVAAAWDEVYWLFASQLIAAEASLRQREGMDLDHPWRPWRVTGRVQETEDIVSLCLAPADGAAAPEFVPGQYTTVAVELPDGTRQARQYTLSLGPGREGWRITVRHVHAVASAPDGMVSTHLCTNVNVGDVLSLSPPFGDFALTPGGQPVLLLSAGVGITPMVAMIDHLARTQPDRAVVAVHADRTRSGHPLRDDVLAAGAQLFSFRELTWYEQRDDDGELDAYDGLVDVAKLPIAAGSEAYLCGPLPFMRHVRTELVRHGVHPQHIHYEVFGSDLWAGNLDAA